MITCDHCMLPVKDDEAILDESPNGTRRFCCHACRAIYRMIQEEGLGEFYKKRQWSAVGIPEELRNPSDPRASQHVAGAEAEITAEDDVGLSDLLIEGIRCASCVWLNEKVLERTPGVLTARVNFATHRAQVRWDRRRTNAAAITSRIRSIGYLPRPYTPAALEESLHRLNRDLLIRFGTAAFFSMQIMTVSFALYAGYFQGIDLSTKKLLEGASFLLSTPVLLYSGWPFITGAWKGIRQGVLNMDALIVMGSGSAYLLSIFHLFRGGEVYFDTAAMIVTLVLLGRYLENSAKQRASLGVSRLLALQPREARLIRGQDRIMVGTETVRKGDLLEVRPGEKVPMDGIVRDGTSEVNESLISGESLPRLKTAGADVIGGSINGLGSLAVEVTRVGEETVLSQIAALVERAQMASAPVQRLADRISAYFIPVILALAGASYWYWSQHVPNARAALIAVSVMVISCPCALGLATPVAILAGTGSAARMGVLIKGGDILERMHTVDTVVLDKTGTVTKGRFSVVEIMSLDGTPASKNDLLCAAASVEQASEHLLGRAIVAHAKAEGVPLVTVERFMAVPGAGAWGVLEGQEVVVGTADLLAERRIPVPEALQREAERCAAQGMTRVYVARGGQAIGFMGLMDTPKDDAGDAIRRLNKAHIRTTMITGDSAETGAAIAKQVGIDHVLAGVLPHRKAEEVLGLRRGGSVVAMVGDGINDAPALATADVGVAMASGSDIAVESAHVVLLRSDLSSVAEAIFLSRRTFRIIRQNLFWAFFYNVSAVPLAMAGLLSPIVAAAAMSVSSVTVVLNSLRLKRGMPA